VTFKLWELLKNASEVTLVPKDFFPKMLDFVQSFVECKVSLADGNFTHNPPDSGMDVKTEKEYFADKGT
jgi:hypothetical protein